MVFPVAGVVSYSDTFGAPRSGGRKHEGQDLMGKKGTTLVAAADGMVTYLKHDVSGLSGNMMTISDADGWQYVYIHINNDHPGTDDAANVFEQAFVDGMRQGQRVVAGEPVAYLGDSGNAEDVGSHLHFELHTPDGAAVNAFASLKAATHSVFSAAQVVAAAPTGAVDVLAASAPGTLHAVGWALDKVVDDSVPVSVFVDGNPVSVGLADGARPDLAAAFPDRVFADHANAHGFDLSVGGVPSGSHVVCLILHNAGSGGGSARIGCTTLAVS